MNATRVAQITDSLKGLGTQANVLYSNQEIIDKLIELQSALAKGVFEKTHAEFLRDQEVMTHFETLAQKYGLDKSDTYLRFKENMRELGYTIGTFIKGKNGERITKKALKLLSYDKGVKIIFNISLEDEDSQAEYDAIVLAPYGLFVVEVKNWYGNVTITPAGVLVRDCKDHVTYDLIGRMNIKEALLREYLGDLFPKQNFNVLVFADERTEVNDQYHRVPYCVGSGVTNEIRTYAKMGAILTEEQIAQISECIMKHHKEQKTICTVKCEDIIQDYAVLMAQIEACASGEEALSQKQVGTDDILTVKSTREANSGISIEGDRKFKPKTRNFFANVNWNAVGRVAGFVAIAIPGVIATTGSYKR